MPSIRGIALVSLAGTAATGLIAVALDLSTFGTIVAAAALSVNYWAARGLWRARRGR